MSTEIETASEELFDKLIIYIGKSLLTGNKSFMFRENPTIGVYALSKEHISILVYVGIL